MTRTNRNRLLVPESADALNQLKTTVMRNQGYHVNSSEDVKYEVAQTLGIPLRKGYNGNLEAKNAGKIGGEIGGNMVKEMIRLAQEKLSKQ
ncbi:MAG TPA: alpha/beta-type small acid-soluble spore protein [Bacillota bacterium]|nr:alpha/beta-type small acid-soluble spore protein [Bacillota bacterium]